MSRAPLLAVALVALVAALAVSAAALGARSSAGPEQRAKPAPGLPGYTAGYRRWTKLNARPIPPRASDPHSGTKNVYASRLPGRKGVYPVGTVIVKDAVRPGRGFVGLVAVMRKVKGFDARNNNWQMIEWVRDARTARFRELARGGVCTSCHAGARATDYVFTRRGR